MYGEFREGEDNPDKSGATYKNLTIREPGVVVKNAVVAGDLYVTEGVGYGDATFENVTVKGRVLIAGGGPNSVTFKGSALNGIVLAGNFKTHIDITNSNVNSVTFEASGSFSFNDRLIVYDAETKTLSFTGQFDSITKTAEGTYVIVIDGTTITINVPVDTSGKDGVTLLLPLGYGTSYTPTPTSSDGKRSIGQPVPNPATGGYKITYINTQIEPIDSYVDPNSYAFNGSATLLGGDIMATPAAKVKDSGETFELPEFVGWNTDEYYRGDFYLPGATLTITGNTTLYAVWSGTGQKNGAYDYAYVVYDPDSLKVLQGGFPGGTDFPGNVVFANNVTLDTGFFDDGFSVSPLTLNDDLGYPVIINGNGHIVSFSEKVDMVGDKAGLFDTIHDFITVTDLDIICNIAVSSSNNYAIIGGIAAVNEGIVEGCSTSGTITATDNSLSLGLAIAGGVVGFNDADVITLAGLYGSITGLQGGVPAVPSTSVVVRNCSSTATVTANADLTNGKAVAGGIVGFNSKSGNAHTNNTNNSVFAAGATSYRYEGFIVGYQEDSPLRSAPRGQTVSVMSTELIGTELPTDQTTGGDPPAGSDPTDPRRWRTFNRPRRRGTFNRPRRWGNLNRPRRRGNPTGWRPGTTGRRVIQGCQPKLGSEHCSKQME